MQAHGIVTRLEANKRRTCLFLHIQSIEDLENGFQRKKTHRVTVLDDYRDDVSEHCTIGCEAMIEYDAKSGICTGIAYKAKRVKKKKAL